MSEPKFRLRRLTPSEAADLVRHIIPDPNQSEAQSEFERRLRLIAAQADPPIAKSDADR